MGETHAELIVVVISAVIIVLMHSIARVTHGIICSGTNNARSSGGWYRP